MRSTDTFSNEPLNIRWNGGRYKEARLSREESAVDAAPCSDSQTPGRFISSSKFRNAINELGSWCGYLAPDPLDKDKEITNQRRKGPTQY